jgi:hypothetical protein
VAVSLVTCFEIPLFKAFNPPEILRSPVPSLSGTDHLLHLNQKRENTIVKIKKFFHVRRYISLLR